MRSNGLRLGLALLALSFLTACAGARRAVFDASAVPEPPKYTAKFKRDLAAEIEAAPRNDLIIQALVDASQHYDRIRRLKGKKGKPRNE
ncbi:hypothetical protein KUV26_16870 [Leisingera daeponensis]|uniref:Lipoprotein n=1 Tax=Leisingera daeponensis TaxID=405746 RepID=A0ABS7NLT4_9RHOB|nr:hypothetical protein [Leisingera daeponensis]MBY6141111.1 hypothetical protein [Leisingera daeponensis]